jgi:DnaJ-domain-containing protein 1
VPESRKIARAPHRANPGLVQATLGRGELVRWLYRLGRQGGSGILTLTPTGSRRGEVFVLRRGAVVVADGELARRTLVARLARLVALDDLALEFEGGVTAYPPGTQHQVPLAAWARAHLEAQLDSVLADVLVRQLAGVRLMVRPEVAPDPALCDETDLRMLAAMAQPRRLEQICSLARTPRFRLLAFLHFLRAVDALDAEGVVAEKSAPTRIVDSRRASASRVLGLPEDADLDAIKRAYRRLARDLHPDLQPDADDTRRRALERRFAEVTAAYEALL